MTLNSILCHVAANGACGKGLKMGQRFHVWTGCKNSLDFNVDIFLIDKECFYF